ncbi:MAG: DUF2067 family protein [Candidatus Helarchaeota archaeon]
MAKTRKKELVFHIKEQEKKTKFLELLKKKVTMVNINVTLKLDKVMVKISGTHESVKYAIQLIKKIRNSLGD